MTTPDNDPAEAPAQDGAPDASPPEKDGRPTLGALLRPRFNGGQLLVGLLCLVVGFAVATQVEAGRGDAKFATARQDELVGVLDDLTQRSDRLRQDLAGLQSTKAQLETDTKGDAALQEARDRAWTYGVLAGTVPVAGPGIELTIVDPQGRVDAGVLLDTLQELRDAGAEVIQVNEVRLIVSSHFTDTGGRVRLDGRTLRAPYRFRVIGDSETLATALDIPGGVTETLRGLGATGVATKYPKLTISAVRPPPGPDPTGSAGGGG